MRAALLALALLTAGCLTAGCGSALPYQGMSAEQITAAVKDKNLTAWCSVVNSPYGKGILQVLNLDRQVVPAGSTVKVDDACKVEITTGAK